MQPRRDAGRKSQTVRSLIIIVIHQIVFQGMFFAKNIWLSRKLQVTVRGGNREARTSIAFLGFFIALSLVLAAFRDPPGSIELLSKTSAATVAVLLLVLNTCVGLASLLGLRDSWRVGVLEEQKTELVEDGIYLFTRNPYFVAYLIMFAAYTILLQSVVLLLLSFPGFALIHAMVLKEERYLAAVHGERYREYRRRVPRYLIR